MEERDIDKVLKEEMIANSKKILWDIKKEYNQLAREIYKDRKVEVFNPYTRETEIVEVVPHISTNAAYIAAKQEIKAALKDSNGQFGSFISEGMAQSLVKYHTAKHGIEITRKIFDLDDPIKIEETVKDANGMDKVSVTYQVYGKIDVYIRSYWEEDEFLAYAGYAGGKNQAKNPHDASWSATTTANRYAIMKAFDLPTTEDDNLFVPESVRKERELDEKVTALTATVGAANFSFFKSTLVPIAKSPDSQVYATLNAKIATAIEKGVITDKGSFIDNIAECLVKAGKPKVEEWIGGNK